MNKGCETRKKKDFISYRKSHKLRMLSLCFLKRIVSFLGDQMLSTLSYFARGPESITSVGEGFTMCFRDHVIGEGKIEILE